jgi:glycerophosphoryl diester phosphodiesterase
MREFKVIGHRGACAHEPENTLRSIGRAIADGADMVEIDVRYAAGEVLVIHDATVDRTTNGHGSIHRLSFAEIRDLDAGKGERIPTLAEVIDITRGVVPLNIEIKEPGATGPVCDLIDGGKGSRSRDFLISSSHAEVLVEASVSLPGIPIGIIDGGRWSSNRAMFKLADQVQAISIHPHLRSVSRSLIERAREQNLIVLPFTVRNRRQLLKLLEFGADGCFADDPKWAADLVK